MVIIDSLVDMDENRNVKIKDLLLLLPLSPTQEGRVKL